MGQTAYGRALCPNHLIISVFAKAQTGPNFWKCDPHLVRYGSTLGLHGGRILALTKTLLIVTHQIPHLHTLGAALVVPIDFDGWPGAPAATCRPGCGALHSSPKQSLSNSCREPGHQNDEATHALVLPHHASKSTRLINNHSARFFFLIL
jgi:hypothetical protein